MPFGPIVDAELLRIARQKQWYIYRFVIGLAIIGACIWPTHGRRLISRSSAPAA